MADICGRGRDKPPPNRSFRNRIEARETGRTTQIGARYGCFLPDLTGLARDLSAAGLPRHYISCRHRQGKHRLLGRGSHTSVAHEIDAVELVAEALAGRERALE